jgi:hypothetical protein
MLSHDLYFRHRKFASWFRSEAMMHRHDRNSFIPIVDTKFHTQQITFSKILKELKMAKKKDSAKFVWKGYANINVPVSEESKLEKFVKDDKDVWVRYTSILQDGYRVSFSHDNDKNVVRCSATCHNPDDPNFGMAMSSFAGDWYTSLAVMLFKHFFVSDTLWGETQTSTERKWG